MHAGDGVSRRWNEQRVPGAARVLPCRRRGPRHPRRMGCRRRRGNQASYASWFPWPKASRSVARKGRSTPHRCLGEGSGQSFVGSHAVREPARPSGNGTGGSMPIVLPPLGISRSFAANVDDSLDPRSPRISKWELQLTGKKVTNSPYVASCMQSCLTGLGAALWRSSIRSTASVRNLMRCGSVWECPPCSFKVSARRSSEVLEAINGCQAAGGSVKLLTLTFPHGRTDQARELRMNLSHAWRWMTKHRDWSSSMAAVGVHGTIRALEITWGQANGWHPHLHVLLFLDKEIPDDSSFLESLRSSVLTIWRQACFRAGLPSPSDQHGVDIRGGDRAAGYVAKWGLHTEITLSSLKKGRGDRYTPWELLAQLNYTGSVVWHYRWREYVNAVSGSKQLQWSRGLKRRYRVGEVSDEELATNGGDADETLFCWITPSDWRLIYAQKQIGAMLVFAAAGDKSGFAIWLSGVRQLSSPSNILNPVQ